MSVQALTTPEPERSAPPDLTLAQAARIVREAMRDKSYQDMPLGADAAAFLRAKCVVRSVTISSSRCLEAANPERKRRERTP